MLISNLEPGTTLVVTGHLPESTEEVHVHVTATKRFTKYAGTVKGFHVSTSMWPSGNPLGSIVGLVVNLHDPWEISVNGQTLEIFVDEIETTSL